MLKYGHFRVINGANKRLARVKAENDILNVVSTSICGHIPNHVVIKAHIKPETQNAYGIQYGIPNQIPIIPASYRATRYQNS